MRGNPHGTSILNHDRVEVVKRNDKKANGKADRTNGGSNTMKGLNLIELYCDKRKTNVFDVGFVIEENEEWYYIFSIDENGRSSNFELIKKETVFMAQEDTEYLNKLSEQLGAFECDRINDLVNSQPAISSCISELMNNKTVVQIELYSSNTVDVEGTIIQYGSKEIKVSLVENGNNKGVARISPDAITRIAWDGIE